MSAGRNNETTSLFRPATGVGSATALAEGLIFKLKTKEGTSIMCFSKDELIPLSEAQAKLANEGLEQGTKAYLRAAQRFSETGMKDENGEPLFYEYDEHRDGHAQVGVTT